MPTKKELEKQLTETRLREKAFAATLADANTALRDRVTELSILCRLADVFRIELDLQTVCSGIIEILLEETEAQNCSLFLTDETGSGVVLKAVRGWQDEDTRFFNGETGSPVRFSFGEGVIGLAARQRSPILIADTVEDERFSVRPGQKVSVRSLLSVPLVDQDQTIGVVNLSHSEPGAFSESGKRLLAIASGQAAVAIRNVELVGSLRALNRDLEKRVEERTASLRKTKQKLEMAWADLDEEFASVGEIQRALLPLELPQRREARFSAYYTPASRAGGDYYDFLELPGGRLGIAVADVSGHGAPAAVVMAITRTILRSCASSITSPAETLRTLNRLLHRQITTEQYVTMLYAVLSRSGKTLHFASAGHCPPAVVNQTGFREFSEHNGIPLCFLPEVEYSEGRIYLSPGDKTVFYTDGLVETFNGRNERYGVERLSRTLQRGASNPAEKTLKQVIQSMNRFRGKRPLQDDVTMVIMETLSHSREKVR